GGAQQVTHRTVVRDRVRRGPHGTHVVASVRVGTVPAAQVVRRLDVRLLDGVEAAAVVLPQVEHGARDRLAAGGQYAAGQPRLLPGGTGPGRHRLAGRAPGGVRDVERAEDGRLGGGRVVPGVVHEVDQRGQAPGVRQQDELLPGRLAALPGRGDGP